MAEARHHDPKLRALRAYERGELRGAGRARLERHLAGCATCRAALAGQRRYDALLGHARAAEPPEPPWPRMQVVLLRAAARARRRARLRRLVPAVAALAAAVALLVFAADRYRPRPALPASARGPLAPARVAVSEPARLAVRVSALVGQAEVIDAEGQRRQVDLDSELREGWIVETASASELHLALGSSAVARVDDRARLRLARARDGDIVLALERGRVINAVRPLPAGARYRVEALGHEVVVRGTHFSVEHHARGLGVQVDEGWVSVLRDGELVADLRAPRRWLQGGDGGEPAAGYGALVRPREPAAGYERWPALLVPAWPRVAGWEIDSARLGAGAELAMRVPPGGVDIVALLQDGRRVRARIQVDAVGARFDPRGLALGDEVSDARRAPPAADPARAAAVIRAAQPDLQRCYERSLRNGPDAPGVARLRIEIDARGRVRSAELSAAETLPALLVACIRTVAERWQFPAPGGTGIAFEAPVRFRARN